MQKQLTITLLLTLLAASSALAQPRFNYVEPQDELVRSRIEDWQDLKFGLFIHWGTYSMIPTIESWSICPDKKEWVYNSRPYDVDYFDYVNYYENLYKSFNPVNFDPDRWAEAARDAGMKYVVFTTKHHDGFCMFDTQQTDYKVTSTDCPFHKNPRSNIAAEVFEAFRNKGLKAGAYFSIADWHCDNYWWRHFPPYDRYINYDPVKFPERYDGFVDFIDAQVDELTSSYGDLELMWLDLCEISETYTIRYPWERLARTARTNQPGLIMVARGTHGEYENYYTSELKIPPTVLDYPWEACMTLGRCWDICKDPCYKPTSQVIRMLVTIVARGGNLLLGAGPGPDGEFYDEVYQRLAEIGDWIDVCGKGIYGSKPAAPYQQGEDIFYTQKDGKLYAFYLYESTETQDNSSVSPSTPQLPSELVLEGLDLKRGSKLTMLGSRNSLKWASLPGGSVRILIPEKLRSNPPSRFAVCLEIDRK